MFDVVYLERKERVNIWGEGDTRYFVEFLLKDSPQMDQGHESGFSNKIFGFLDMLKFCA